MPINQTLGQRFLGGGQTNESPRNPFSLEYTQEQPGQSLSEKKGTMDEQYASKDMPPQSLLSQSGFDIVTTLVKMATRPNPRISLGPIDLSCAFLVADMRLYDLPIVYVSPTFEEMTGFSTSEILGRNCRFLQHPTQDVFQGQQRPYTDQTVVAEMKKCVDAREEGQFTLVNYKKSGEPFLNHLTIIPISLSGKDFTHYVGLQIDLVKQPQAIMERLQNGTYSINYHQAEEKAVAEEEVHVSKVTPSFIEAVPDFIHVLSLRGLFLHVSPEASKRLLEYDAEEMVGHKISEFVHPSDLVTVMRDLRNCSAEGSVNFICRMKRKLSGYLYMELNGHVYSGSKRNRCFIISGRERPILSLPQNIFYRPEARIESETWVKISPQGLILFCTASGVKFGLLFGLSLFELADKSCHQALRDALASEVHETVTLVIPQCTCSARILHVVDSLGATRWMQVRKSMDRDMQVGDSNLFGIIQGVRSSSIYYECNKIRVKNARLLEEIQALS